MLPLVSVLIPVFNSENYISDCIDSVLSQTYAHLEVIVIDDGSTDNSLNLLKRYQKNNEIELLEIEHSGQSVARNIGIEHAKGKYLIFIDSDDCWNQNTLEVTVLLAEEEQLDMVLFDANTFIDDKITDSVSLEYVTSYFNTVFQPDTYVRNAPTGIISGGDYLTYQLDKKRFIASPVLYLYNRIKFKDIRFVPGIIHEDNAFTMELFVSALKIKATATKLYRRRIRKNSIMTTPYTMVNVDGYLSVIQRMREVYSLMMDENMRKTIIDLMCMTLSKCAGTLRKINVEKDGN